MLVLASHGVCAAVLPVPGARLCCLFAKGWAGCVYIGGKVVHIGVYTTIGVYTCSMASTTSRVRSVRVPNDLDDRLLAVAGGKDKVGAYLLNLILMALNEPAKSVNTAPSVNTRRTPDTAPQPKAGYSSGHRLGCTCMLCDPPKD